MRFALMIEPQQGLSYGDQVAIAKRAEANGFETLFRSDHYRAFRVRPGSRRPMPGRSSPGSPARPTGSGSGTLVSPVTFRHPGNFAKVVTTVDEMSGGRIEVGVGAGWNDARAPPARPAVPADQGAGRHDGGAARRSSTGCGASRTAGRSRATTSRSRTPRSTRSRSTSRAGRGRRSAARGRGCWSAARARRASYPARRALRGRVQPRPRRARTRRARRSPPLDAACEAIGRDPATMARSAMAGVLIGRDEAEVADALTAAVDGVRRPDDDGERLARRAPQRAGSSGRPTQAREQRPPLRRGRRRADHAPGLPAVGPRHDRRHGRGAGRTGLGPSANDLLRRRRRPRGARR